MGWTRRQFSKRRKAICAAQLLKRPLQLGVDFTELARCFLDLSSMCAFVIRQDAGYRSDGKEHQDLDELIDAVLGVGSPRHQNMGDVQQSGESCGKQAASPAIPQRSQDDGNVVGALKELVQPHLSGGGLV